jgi:hypothetical protein
MLTNFFLASLLIGMAMIALISLNSATSVINTTVRSLLRITRRSKLLTEYILRAYIRYRKTISKPVTYNQY